MATAAVVATEALRKPRRLGEGFIGIGLSFVSGAADTVLRRVRQLES
jgi:hypothetical protein